MAWMNGMGRQIGAASRARTAEQAFLAAHPNLAATKPGRERDQWLAKHPGVAFGYVQAQAKDRPDAGITRGFPGGDKATGGPGGTAAPAAAAPGPITMTSEQQSAKAAVTDFLNQYGLGSLGDAAWQRYLETGSSAVVFSELRSGADWSKGAYAARFPGMAELAKQGRAITEDQYIQLESGYQQQMRAYGLPPSFYDNPDDFGKLIAGNVSAQEFGDRLAYAEQVTMQSPKGQAMREALARDYGMNNAQGLTTAFWIDPDNATKVLKQQYQAAEASAASQLTGFGTLTKDQAEKVGSMGLNYDQAASAFSNLASLKPLTADLPGQGPDGLDTNTLIDAGLGQNADAQRKVKQVQQKRAAAFQGGGSFATGSGGISGLGSAGA